MIVAIQCAATKRPDAGRLVTDGGTPVELVAVPKAAPPSTHLYARPDDLREDGQSWRQILLDYNERAGSNPLRLLRAFELYQNETYRRLVRRFGVEHVYIVSAGWGLIRADFLTPAYDITFSISAEHYKRRKQTDRYNDFAMIPADTADDVIFLGGRDYLPIFCKLTREIRSRKLIFFNSSLEPKIDGYVMRRYETSTRTNWHYECAAALLNGSIQISA
jgi:hypothetical protein